MTLRVYRPDWPPERGAVRFLWRACWRRQRVALREGHGLGVWPGTPQGAAAARCIQARLDGDLLADVPPALRRLRAAARRVARYRRRAP